jgi:hypothetical protein
MKTLMICLIILVALACISQAAILYVDKDDTAPYTEVQPAINAASAGDTIMIAPSFNTYSGFTVDRFVHIIGAGTDTLPGQASKINGTVQINGSADNSELLSLWIAYGSDQIDGDSLAAVVRIGSGAQGIRFSRCYIENTYSESYYSGYCIWIGQNTEVTITSCGLVVINHNVHTCIKLAPQQNTSILNVSNSIMLWGQISGGGIGTVIEVRHCFVHESQNRGIISGSNAGGTIKNTFLHNSDGAAFFVDAPNFAASYCATYGAVPGGAGNIAANAWNEYVHWVPYGLLCQSDYHLAAGSQLQDAGDPITPPDLDGSRADIGVYGGQTPFVYFGLPDIPFVTGLEVPASVPQNGVLHIGSTGRVGEGGGE